MNELAIYSNPELAKLVGRKEGFSFIPDYSSTFSLIKTLQGRSRGEQMVFLDQLYSGFEKEVELEVRKISRVRKSRSFFLTDLGSFESSLKMLLVQLGINLKYRPLGEPGEIPGVLYRKNGKLYIEFNGIESLIHESEHFLQLADSDGMFPTSRSNAYYVGDFYAKLASLRAISRLGSGVKMWPVFSNYRITVEEQLDDFIGMMDEEINLGYTHDAPLLEFQKQSPDK